MGQAEKCQLGKLPRDRQLQRRIRLGVVHTEDPLIPVHPLPPERQHLAQPHTREHAEPEHVPERGIAHHGLNPSPPARQDLGRRRDLAPRLVMEPAAAREPEIDRIGQSPKIHAGPAVDRAKQRHALVGRRPAVLPGDAVEALLHVLARDGIQRTGQPVAEGPLETITVALVGDRLALGIGLHVLLEGLPEGGHAPAPGAGCGGIFAHGDHAEQPVCLFARQLGGHSVASSDDEALVGGGPAAIAEAVVDDIGLDAGGMDEDAVSCELVVPCDPRLVGRLEAVDGAPCDGELDARGSFSGAVHGGMVSWRGS